MSINFYNEIGFTKTDIAIYSKTIGWGATIIFSLSAGFIMVRFGLLKGLFISGVAMALTNLLYSAIAIVGPSTELFFWTILLDNFTSSVSSVAFVAFISNLCGRESVAVEYAFLASIGSFGRTFLSSFSGVLVDYLDGNWGLFFAITAIMTIPSLIMLFFIYKKTSTKLRN
jgi:PAT family beta-lactamase induction signal transducer AmpG